MKYFNFRFFIKVVLISITVLVFTSCSNSSNDSNDCPVAVDTVNIIDEKVVGNAKYYLVLRISGWHDKSEIVELYNVKPSFDRCSISDVEPVYGNSLELDKTVAHLYFDVETKLLNIEYKDGEPSKAHNKNLKIEIK